MKILVETVLWKYQPLKNGEFAIQVRLTKYRDVKYISTGYSASPECWDEKNNSPTTDHPKYRNIIKEIDKIIENVQFEIKLSEKQDEILTMAELKSRVVDKQDVKNPKKVLEFFDEIIREN